MAEHRAKLTQAPAKPLKTVLFHRRFRSFTGGHLKVADYFDHVGRTSGFSAAIYLTDGSVPSHPWRGADGLVDRYEPESADVLFIAGTDWEALDAFPGIEARVPVINLIQGVRHADRGSPLRAFLRRRAVRICVSGQVAECVRATGECNGPVHVINNGIRFDRLPAPIRKTADVFIAGLKNPGVARALAGRLGELGLGVDCETGPIDRALFLERMAAARIAVVLPREREGFFLPALEAMALGCAVISPDCVGNRSFCLDRRTCLLTPANADALEGSVLELIADPMLAGRLREAGLKLARTFDIRAEREAFQRILRGIDGP